VDHFNTVVLYGGIILLLALWVTWRSRKGKTIATPVAMAAPVHTEPTPYDRHVARTCARRWYDRGGQDEKKLLRELARDQLLPTNFPLETQENLELFKRLIAETAPFVSIEEMTEFSQDPDEIFGTWLARQRSHGKLPFWAAGMVYDLDRVRTLLKEAATSLN
jgi:hypothetical protein